MIRWIWEIVVVVAATMAVVTNAVLIASNFDVSKQLAQQQTEINELFNAKFQSEARDEQIQKYLIELTAQVRYGLRDRYEVEE